MDERTSPSYSSNEIESPITRECGSERQAVCGGYRHRTHNRKQEFDCQWTSNGRHRGPNISSAIIINLQILHRHMMTCGHRSFLYKCITLEIHITEQRTGSIDSPWQLGVPNGSSRKRLTHTAGLSGRSQSNWHPLPLMSSIGRTIPPEPLLPINNPALTFRSNTQAHPLIHTRMRLGGNKTLSSSIRALYAATSTRRRARSVRRARVCICVCGVRPT
jgi:hypothetical protein